VYRIVFRSAQQHPVWTSFAWLSNL